jgi:hypothetical protein
VRCGEPRNLRVCRPAGGRGVRTARVEMTA